jgi:glycosyltransferase involved in cell wall biosynthesis
VAIIYFDITNIVAYAKRNSTVIGIPRVQLNIISMLSRKHGGARIRCTFYDFAQRAMVEFDPAQLQMGFEFDSEKLLRLLGLDQTSRWLPSNVQVKSYLRKFSHNKLLRTVKKADVYVSALLLPKRLQRLGLQVGGATQSVQVRVAATRVDALPADSRYVCLGAIWMLPELWEFGQAHKDRGGEVVQMVYDLIPFSYPEYYAPREPPAFAAWLNQALEYTARFICISRWTDADLHKYAQGRGQAVTSKPIPLAHEFAGFDRTTPVAMPPQLDSLSRVEYILCVGTIEHRKNNLVLLKIWQQLRTTLKEKLPLLVFAGKYGRGGAEFQSLLASDLNLAQSVRVLHSPSDADLAWLYQRCLFTVYPSQFEGWGLPVGEAAWFGKYCVASATTSVPEVCGPLVDYVDPHDSKSITDGILKPLLDREFLKQREVAIGAAKLREWSHVADDIYAYASAAHD